MEIATAPRSPAALAWRRWLALAVALAPVTLFVLLPIGLGLERYVVTGDSMAPALGRGTVVFERVVPVSDIRVGDVVTYPHPTAADPAAVVTHRVVAIRPDGLLTKGDGVQQRDPWVVRPAGASLSRVAFSVPLVGWVYLAVEGSGTWLAAVLVAGAAAVTLRRRSAPVRRSGATGHSLPSPMDATGSPRPVVLTGSGRSDAARANP